MFGMKTILSKTKLFSNQNESKISRNKESSDIHLAVIADINESQARGLKLEAS